MMPPPPVVHARRIRGCPRRAVEGWRRVPRTATDVATTPDGRALAISIQDRRPGCASVAPNVLPQWISEHITEDSEKPSGAIPQAKPRS